MTLQPGLPPRERSERATSVHSNRVIPPGGGVYTCLQCVQAEAP